MNAFTYSNDRLSISAGLLSRTLRLPALIGRSLTTRNMEIESNALLGIVTSEVGVRVTCASPNLRPQGLSLEDAGSITQENQDQNKTDGLRVEASSPRTRSTRETDWINPLLIDGSTWDTLFTAPEVKINGNQCTISYRGIPETPARNLQIEILFDAFPEYSVIRKHLLFTNLSTASGPEWLKIDQLVLDPIEFNTDFPTITNLTPSERGAVASVLGRTNTEGTRGVIIGNEIPSALRDITSTGASGYSPKLFEHILGPGETFESEAVWYMGFTGPVEKTVSGVSTPLDRTVEGQLQDFYREILKMPVFSVPLPAPVWCTWSNMVANISDKVVREQADLAQQIGFHTLQVDAGWAISEDPSDWTAGGMEPHPDKFPAFSETCQYVRGLKLRLGLWTSCFRSPSSKDLRDMPEARSLPLIKRGHCFGMSYASPWREYYAKDLVSLVNDYGASYFKQDLTNIKFGDFAEGHESRSLKDSYLRALRGLLESQRLIHADAPGVWTMLSHEIYWGTPGVPCDLAVLKSACGFHIPPNDYSGCGPRRQRWKPSWKNTFHKKSLALKRGCWHARTRYYAHRGLPLPSLEYYGVATVNIGGSLTPQIQDRQICSWLMGMPSVYAGDLLSLTPENIAHYRKRFDLLKSLETKFGIYRYYQYSGVPPPTDIGWHWWGKLNGNQEGVVVVLRGFLGRRHKRINIPWVDPDTSYKVTACFQERPIGTFTGKYLQVGRLKITLPRWGQEILKIEKETDTTTR